jgi:predicted enzyme related to lactoylglutathione lyase
MTLQPGLPSPTSRSSSDHDPDLVPAAQVQHDPAEVVDDDDRAARRMGLRAAHDDRPAGDVGDLHVGTVVINVKDMERAVAFWSAALDYRRPAVDQDDFTTLVPRNGRGVPVSLQRTDEPTRGPVPVHLDLYTSEQALHVDRLVDLGASRVPDWPYPGPVAFVVLRDPDGNEFCVIDHSEAATS